MPGPTASMAGTLQLLFPPGLSSSRPFSAHDFSNRMTQTFFTLWLRTPTDESGGHKASSVLGLELAQPPFGHKSRVGSGSVGEGNAPECESERHRTAPSKPPSGSCDCPAFREWPSLGDATVQPRVVSEAFHSLRPVPSLWVRPGLPRTLPNPHSRITLSNSH